MAPLGAEKPEVLVKLLDTALGGRGCMSVGVPTARRVTHRHAAAPTLFPWGVIIGVDLWPSFGTMGRYSMVCMAPLGAEK